MLSCNNKIHKKLIIIFGYIYYLQNNLIEPSENTNKYSNTLCYKLQLNNALHLL